MFRGLQAFHSEALSLRSAREPGGDLVPGVPFDETARYVDAALAAGDPVELLPVDADHLDLITTLDASWPLVRDAIFAAAHD